MSEENLISASGVSDAPAADAEAAERESMPGVEVLLRQAELRAKEHEDAWLRAKAETENVRRRASEDVEKARKFAIEGFARELLAVKDSLEAALAVGDAATLESIRDGVNLTLKQLASVFEKNNIKEINPLGDKFDPNSQQAIGVVEGEGEANCVANVLQKGYFLNERVIRPAMVMVFKGS